MADDCINSHKGKGYYVQSQMLMKAVGLYQFP